MTEDKLSQFERLKEDVAQTEPATTTKKKESMRFAMFITRKEHERLRKFAFHRGVSQAAVVVQGLNMVFKETGEKPFRE